MEHKIKAKIANFKFNDFIFNSEKELVAVEFIFIHDRHSSFYYNIKDKCITHYDIPNINLCDNPEDKILLLNDLKTLIQFTYIQHMKDNLEEIVEEIVEEYYEIYS